MGFYNLCHHVFPWLVSRNFPLPYTLVMFGLPFWGWIKNPFLGIDIADCKSSQFFGVIDSLCCLRFQNGLAMYALVYILNDL